jgi:signal transduction histidine kinase
VRRELLPPVDADPDQLKEVLVNLIINACEAMAKGGTITIEELAAFKPGDRREVVVRISDSGPGIPAGLHDKVFEPFFTTKEEGTGLGLSIAKRIINEHEGRLEIADTHGGGTTFIMTLPVKE